MTKFSNKILDGLKGKKFGVFVDDANLFYAKKKVGWQVDFDKLKSLLQEIAQVEFIHYHIALPAKWDTARRATDFYLAKIKDIVDLKIKPLKYIRHSGSFKKKGDVDLEIAVDIMRNLAKIDAVLIISGDSDYVELRNFILEQGKQVIFLAFKENMAWEIKTGKYVFLNRMKEYIKLE